MKTPQTTPKKQKLLKLFLFSLGGIAIALFILVGGAYIFSRLFVTNYAQETAMPLETSLEKAGAIKNCTTGDSGRGPDNRSPWYNAYYSIPKNENDAISVAYSAASQEGYKLTHATIGNKGPVAVDDKFIDKWYFDNSKQSSYKDLNQGFIQLTITVNAHGTDGVCGGGQTKIDSDHSVIGIGIKLPEYK